MVVEWLDYKMRCEARYQEIENSKTNLKVDIANYITMRTLSMRVDMYLMNVVDWLNKYLCGSLSISSWFYSCGEKDICCFEEFWRLTFHFNYLKLKSIQIYRFVGLSVNDQTVVENIWKWISVVRCR